MTAPHFKKESKFTPAERPIYRLKQLAYSSKGRMNLLLVKRVEDLLAVRGSEGEAVDTAERWKALVALRYLKAQDSGPLRFHS